MKRRVDVSDLAIGMYVAELDRPWVGSPFLFQGFTIETDDDIAKLQQYCEYVFVQEGEEDDEDDKGGEAGKGSGGNGKASAEAEPAPSMQSFQKELPRAADAHRKTTSHVSRVFEDARLGRSISTEETKATVSELIDTISVNANASIWLTALKKTHDASAKHSLDVCVLALAFGQSLGYERGKLESLGVGALFHDIGKTRLPAALLDKPPAEMTDAEQEQLRRHPVDGFNVMRLTREVPRESLTVIRSHHERLDGKGYPDGLSGDDVPELARVAALADRYDNLTHDRPGSPAVPPHDALKALREEGGDVFGNDLINKFMRCIGIYPVGSMVQLNTGAVGVVVSSDPSNRLLPVVMMLIDEKGQRYQRKPTISLAARARQADRAPLSISRAMDPAVLGIDLSALVEGEIRA